MRTEVVPSREDIDIVPWWVYPLPGDKQASCSTDIATEVDISASASTAGPYGYAIARLGSEASDRLTSQQARLEQQLAEFERRYSISSKEFHEKFERGELGDAMDFVEWSATYEMAANLRR